MKYKILILGLILFLSLSAVSAADNDTDLSFSDLAGEIETSGSEINIEHDYTYNNLTDDSRGIYVNKTDFTINGNNHVIDANNESALFTFEKGSKVIVNDLIIKNVFFNSIFVLYNGDCDLTLNNVEITDSVASRIGIICTKNSNLTMNNCTIRNIEGSLTYDFTDDADKFAYTFNGCTFSDSRTEADAFIFSYSNITVTDSIFSNIQSKQAGAISHNGYFLTVNNTQFYNMKASKSAGAIFVKSKTVTVSDSRNATKVIIENSLFDNVSSEKNGGAILFDAGGMFFNEDNIAGTMDVINTTFNDCNSGFGGAVLQLNGILNINCSNFTDNSASVSGGAVYTSWTNITSKDNNFINNSAFRYGGAVYMELTDSVFDNNAFAGNSVDNGSEYNPNTIYAYDNKLTVKNSYFNNSKYSISSFFTEGFIDENNTVNDDEFFFNLTVYPFGYIDEGVELELINNTLDVDTLSSRFDSRDWGWVTSVKNQGRNGVCWAFGVVATLEANLLKATGIEFDFSENNVQNSELMYSRYGDIKNAEGGYGTTASGYILSWFGVLPQSEDSYDELGKVSDILYTENKVHVQDVLLIPIKKDGNILSNETSKMIKEALLKYGAVEMTYAGDGEFYDKSSAVYNSNINVSNHLTSIVGWDDNFSKDNFLTTPPGDGAWIFKNSWGDEWGDEGFAYISYYDTSLFALDADDCNELPYTIAFIINSTENYTYNYQTDFMGIRQFNENYSFYSNQFTALSNNLLGAVGTYFNDTGVDYEFKIYVNDELKLTQNGISEFAGFRTIKLNENISLKTGDLFKVVFKNNVLPYQADSREHYLEDMSFISADGENWIDTAPLNQTVCLKLYAFDLEIYAQDLTKIYKNDSKFEANIGIADEKVVFEINGINYTRVSDENGTVKIAINLGPGNYSVKTSFNGTTVENNIEVLPTLTAQNLVKYFKNESQFFITLTDGKGDVVPNATITMNINGVFYNRTTDGNGTAKLNINLSPVEYILTAADPLTGLEMSYNITVLPTLYAEDLEMKYNDSSTFNVTVLNPQGGPLSGALVTFNINGVFYNATSNQNGIALLNITLPEGKYIITSSRNGENIANKVTIVS